MNKIKTHCMKELIKMKGGGNVRTEQETDTREKP